METLATLEETLYGKTFKFILPSGYYVVIREQNGNDDDIISNRATAKDLTNFNIFLSSLIIDTNLPIATNGKITRDNIDKILLRDKYAIIFASRIHSMGAELQFEFSWPIEEGGPQNYVEDLHNYFWDFKEPLPEQGEPGYSPHHVKPYPSDAYGTQELTLSSGKQLRFRYLDGIGEKEIMRLPVEEITRNAELKARGLEQLLDGKWVKVSNFMYFSKKEMAELFKFFRTNDPDFNAITELENPKTGEIIKYPLLQAEDFFFPQEI